MRSIFRRATERPLPHEFLEWQVRLRAWTMRERNGAPHAGVAPILAVQHPGVGAGTTMHAIICGLLPAAEHLADRTAAFRRVYEAHAPHGARAIYDGGIAYLHDYYVTAAAFDPTTITSLLPAALPAVHALAASPPCALLFYVFDLDDRSEERRFRCWQLNCRAEIHTDGPLFENVWWHNALFHGKVDEHVVLAFRHESTYDTRFGALERLAG